MSRITLLVRFSCRFRLRAGEQVTRPILARVDEPRISSLCDEAGGGGGGGGVEEREEGSEMWSMIVFARTRTAVVSLVSLRQQTPD